MKYKRGGITTEQVFNLILGVVVLSLLSFGAGKLYADSQIDSESEAVTLIANNLEKKIEALEVGEESTINVQGFGEDSDEWYIVGWGREDNKRPEKCFLESCVCVCRGNSIDDCNAINGICRIIEGIKDVEVPEVEVTGDGQSVGPGAQPFFEVTEFGIKLRNNLLEVGVIKSEDSVRLFEK